MDSGKSTDKRRFGDYISGGRAVHFIGICGVHMRSLARVARLRGARVTGSDRRDDEDAAALRRDGVTVFTGHSAEHVADAALIVRTSAVHEDNPELREARRRGIPVISRAEALGALMGEFERTICLAGMHGKSTTTGLCALACVEAGLDPTVFGGAVIPAFGDVLRLGKSGLMVAEADEYCDAFLSYHPHTAVILNIDADHLDYFRDLAHIKASFRQFAERLPADGHLVINADDAVAIEATRGIDAQITTFGVESGTVRAVDLELTRGRYSFTIERAGRAAGRLSLKVPGLHNVYDALAAYTAALCEGVGHEAAVRGIEGFRGVSRRFELRGTYNGAELIDDYSHHPTEIRAALSAARAMEPARLICVFQPHTYTRTEALLDDFAAALSLADMVILPDIFAAREENLSGISSLHVAEKIKGARYIPALTEAAAALRSEARPGDLIMVMGAGDVNKIIPMILDP